MQATMSVCLLAVMVGISVIGSDAASLRRQGRMSSETQVVEITHGTCATHGCAAVELAECGSVAGGGEVLEVCKLKVEGDVTLTESPNCLNYPAGCFVEQRAAEKKVGFNSYGASTTPAAKGADATVSVWCTCPTASVAAASDNSEVPLGACGSVKLQTGRLEVVNRAADGAESADTLLQASKGEDAFLALRCAYGHTFDGVRHSDTTVEARCGADGTLSVLVQGKLVPEVPACVPVKCNMNILAEDVYNGEGLARASLTPAAKEASEHGFAHGDLVDSVKCEDGYSFDSMPPAADGMNTEVALECRAGGFYTGLESPPMGGLKKNPGSGEVLGVTCRPVQCSTEAPFFRDRLAEHGAAEMTTYDPSGQPMLVGCLPGYGLCGHKSNKNSPSDASAGDESVGDESAGGQSAVVCDDDAKVAPGSATCKMDGTWESALALDAVVCKPLECDALELDEESGAMGPLKSELFGAYYFQPQAKLNVTVECAPGYTMNGERQGPDGAVFSCAQAGSLEFAAGDPHSRVGRPEEGPICRPMKCVSVAHPFRRHRRAAAAAEEEPPAEDEAHGNSLQLDCPAGYSYDGKGRRAADSHWSARTSSNFERTLLCEAGEYQCTTGWCEYDVGNGAGHDLDCMEVKCTVPSNEAVTSTLRLQYPLLQEVGTTTERGSLEFNVHSLVEFRCQHGYKLPSAASGEVSRTATCLDEWVGETGWSAEVPHCEQDLEYCVDHTAEQLAEAHVQEAVMSQGQHAGAARELTCEIGYTIDNDMTNSRHDKQSTECKPNGDGARGAFLPLLRPCVPITCTNAPQEDLYRSLRPVGRPCEGEGTVCADYNEHITYTCAEGYRWDFTKNGGFPDATSPSSPRDMHLRCTATGEFEFVEKPHGEEQEVRGEAAPRCTAVYCAPRDAQPFAALEATDSRSARLLQSTFKWTGPLTGFEGRTYGDAFSLQCIGGADFKLKCDSNGKFRVRIGQYQDLAAESTTLLTKCGKQLVVEGAEHKPTPSQCMTAMEDLSVAITACDHDGIDSQMWWFDNEGENGCSDKWKVRGDQTVQRWDACGKVRILKADERFDDMCLAPPLKDDNGPLTLQKCSDDIHWLLSTDARTMMFVRPTVGEDSNMDPARKERLDSLHMRYRVFASAQHVRDGAYTATLEDYMPRNADGFGMQRIHQ